LERGRALEDVEGEVEVGQEGGEAADVRWGDRQLADRPGKGHPGLPGEVGERVGSGRAVEMAVQLVAGRPGPPVPAAPGAVGAHAGTASGWGRGVAQVSSSSDLNAAWSARRTTVTFGGGSEELTAES
jgi:hypothetical protein